MKMRQYLRSLTEGVKLDQTMIQSALDDPGMRIGFEFELYCSGVLQFIEDAIPEDGDLRLSDLSYEQLMLYWFPLDSQDTHLDNQDIMRARLVWLAEDTLEAPDLTPREAFSRLVNVLTPAGLVGALRVYPELGFYLRKEEIVAIKQAIAAGNVREVRNLLPDDAIYMTTLDVSHLENSTYDDNLVFREIVYERLSEEIGKIIGSPVRTSTDKTNSDKLSRGYTQWILIPDPSLTIGEYDLDEIGFELVSPVMQATEGVMMMRKLVATLNNPRWQKQTGLSFYASQNTGLHVGVSTTGEIDPLKLIMLLGDDQFILGRFGRENNHFAQSVFRQFLSSVTVTVNDNARTAQTIREIIDGIVRNGIPAKYKEDAYKALGTILQKDKNTSVNLTKLPKGYVEFRSPGGPDYIAKAFPELLDSIRRFITVTHIAGNPNTARREYELSLYRLVQKAISRAQQIARTNPLTNQGAADERVGRGRLGPGRGRGPGDRNSSGN